MTEKKHYTPEEARELILSGNAPDGMIVDGFLDLSEQVELSKLPNNLQAVHLNLSKCVGLTSLPYGLHVWSLNLTDCENLVSLPEDLNVKNLILHGYKNLQTIPKYKGVKIHISKEQVHEVILSGNAPNGINAGGLVFRNCDDLTHLPEDLEVRHLTLSRCQNLKSIPSSIKIESNLNIDNCNALQSLPETLQIENLQLISCKNLSVLPDIFKTTSHKITITDCPKLETLPNNLNLNAAYLEIHDPVGLTSLPQNLKIRYIDLRHCTSIQTLPDDLNVKILSLHVNNEPLIQNTALGQLKKHRIRWGEWPSFAVVPAHVLKHPERLTPQQILDEPNTEVRRIMLERYGEQKFIENLGAEPVQRDKYGVLYRVEIPDDEPLVMVKVQDASTDREYFLRVPPDMQTAHEAVAWTFGMTADEYHPDVET